MAEEKESKKDSSKKGIPFIAKVLIVAIVLILIVVISVGSAFFIASKVNKTSGDGSNTIEKTVKEENTEETTYGTTVDFGEYTVNLREEEPRYLVLRINFELDPELKAKKVTKIQTSITEKKVIGFLLVIFVLFFTALTFCLGTSYLISIPICLGLILTPG